MMKDLHIKLDNDKFNKLKAVAISKGRPMAAIISQFIDTLGKSERIPDGTIIMESYELQTDGSYARVVKKALTVEWQWCVDHMKMDDCWSKV